MQKLIILAVPLLLLLLVVVTSATSSATSDNPTIHAILRENGLPGGLVPKSTYISSYSFDTETGLLSVNLTQPCYARYADTSLAYFDNYIAGNLSFGQLNGVQGLEQEELFVWLPVKGIIEENGSGVILFDIGLAHKRLSRSLFEDPPDCHGPDALIQGERGFKFWIKFPSFYFYLPVLVACFIGVLIFVLSIEYYYFYGYVRTKIWYLVYLYLR